MAKKSQRFLKSIFIFGFQLMALLSSISNPTPLYNHVLVSSPTTLKLIGLNRYWVCVKFYFFY